MDRTLIIIGAGAGGCCLFTQLMDQDRTRFDRIVFVDPMPLGQGLAFDHQDPDVLCNTSVGFNSLFAENPRHFLEWIFRTTPEVTRPWTAAPSALTVDSFVPRGLFQSYLKDMARAARESAARASIAVEQIFAKATRIDASRMGFQVALTPGSHVKGNSVAVCLGSTVPHDPFPGLPRDRCLASPYERPDYHSLIDDGDRVLVLGARLSAVDAAVLVAKTGKASRITLMSRSAALPSVRSSMIEHELCFFTPERALEIARESPRRAAQGWLRLVLREVAEAYHRQGISLRSRPRRIDRDPFLSLEVETELAENKVVAWQDPLATLVNTTNGIWDRIGKRQRQAIKAALAPLARRYVTALPIVNARKLLAFHRQGLLGLIAGPNGLGYDAADRSFVARDANDREHRFDVIIKATGFTSCDAARPIMVCGQPLSALADRIDHRTWRARLPEPARNGSLHVMGPAVGQALPVTNYLNATVRQARAIATRGASPLGLPA